MISPQARKKRALFPRQLEKARNILWYCSRIRMTSREFKKMISKGPETITFRRSIPLWSDA